MTGSENPSEATATSRFKRTGLTVTDAHSGREFVCAREIDTAMALSILHHMQSDIASTLQQMRDTGAGQLRIVQVAEQARKAAEARADALAEQLEELQEGKG